MNKNLETNGFYTLDTPEYYADNTFILKWWNNKLDSLIVSLIEKYQWGWHAEITNSIQNVISNKTLKEYQNADPLCQQYAWYNIIMNFAIARAKRLNYISKIKKPQIKNCKLCNCTFIESNLPFPMIKK